MGERNEGPSSEDDLSDGHLFQIAGMWIFYVLNDCYQKIHSI